MGNLKFKIFFGNFQDVIFHLSITFLQTNLIEAQNETKLS